MLMQAFAILGGGISAHTDYLASLICDKKPKRQYFDPLNQQSILTKAFAILGGEMYAHTDHLASLTREQKKSKKDNILIHQTKSTLCNPSGRDVCTYRLSCIAHI
jgi:hypothetical protein